MYRLSNELIWNFGVVVKMGVAKPKCYLMFKKDDQFNNFNKLSERLHIDSCCSSGALPYYWKQTCGQNSRCFLFKIRANTGFSSNFSVDSVWLGLCWQQLVNSDVSISLSSVFTKRSNVQGSKKWGLKCSEVKLSEVKSSQVMILGEMCVLSFIYSYVAECRVCAVHCLIIICFCFF
jgi:hypothetical protein